MAKNCLNKLVSNIAVECTIPQVGVKGIYLMHAEDVTFTRLSDWQISAVAFAAGAKSYMVEGYKQNIQVTSSLKTTDVSARVDTSVTFKVPYSYIGRKFINTLASGRFCVLVEFNDGGYTMHGDTSPLECSSADFDSNANAKMVTITLTSPEGSAGNHLMGVMPAAVTTIKSKVGS